MRQWSGEADLSIIAPSLAHDRKARERFGASRRMSASPGAALALARMTTEIDVRHVLPHRLRLHRDIYQESGGF